MQYFPTYLLLYGFTGTISSKLVSGFWIKYAFFFEAVFHVVQVSLKLTACLEPHSSAPYLPIAAIVGVHDHMQFEI